MRPSLSGSSSRRAGPSACPPPRRSRTAHATQDYVRGRRESEPWRKVAKTYAWVVEQEFAEMAKKNEDTVRWIHMQQDRARRERIMFEVFGDEEGYYCCANDLVDEEIAFINRCRKPSRSPYQQEMDQMIYEELRRLRAQRAETERCRAAYERRKTMEDERERRRMMKRQAEMARQEAGERVAWENYESRWNRLASTDTSSEPLSFQMIPWPMITPPRTVEDIRPARVTMFVLSPHHSQGQTIKDRVRNALRRWHPDRFGRLLARVKDEDKAKVEQGVGIVARCLNELLERA